MLGPIGAACICHWMCRKHSLHANSLLNLAQLSFQARHRLLDLPFACQFAFLSKLARRGLRRKPSYATRILSSSDQCGFAHYPHTTLPYLTYLVS